MKKFYLLLLALIATGAWAQTLPMPKREFRGAWIQVINGQFQGLGRDRMQAELTRQLDALKRCGVNTVIFQVRGEADALYPSPYEPWSRFLTGQQGRAPQPYWDPLAWMVTECHRRGMELHAWINPFRAKTKGTTQLAVTHPYVRHPERCFAYDGLLILDPGLPANREYICRVAADIVRRYDVDGLHIDDYFYPYPAAGQTIADDATFQRYNEGFTNRADWRRYNVNRFIEMLHDTLRAVKPWVKFGVSPFGIYHNAKPGDPVPGSRTAGLQNYDDLYADVLFWLDEGWVDYTVPQVYWEIGHKAADYATLVEWWARHAAERPLVIGQDTRRARRSTRCRRSSACSARCRAYRAAACGTPPPWRGMRATMPPHCGRTTTAIPPCSRPCPSSTRKRPASHATSRRSGCPTATTSSGPPHAPGKRWTRPAATWSTALPRASAPTRTTRRKS